MNDIIGLWIHMKNSECLLNVSKSKAEGYMEAFQEISEAGLLEVIPMIIHTHRGERHMFLAGSIIKIGLVDYENI